MRYISSEIDPEDEDVTFGLCDLGLGCPKLGSVSLSEIASRCGRLGLPVECDQDFMEKRPINVIAKRARQKGST